MIDIYKYINSQSIEKYLRKIKYKFSTIEALWLVWQSDKVNLIEKQAAYKEIMAEYPNCEFKKEKYYVKDVFKEVKNYIDKQNKDIECFIKNNKNEYYTFKTYYGDIDFDGSTMFTSYDKVIKLLKIPRTKPKFEFGTYIEADKYEVEKHIIENPDSIATVTLDKNADITDISLREEWMSMFMEFYLRFPVPFKKGDLVCFATERYKSPYVYDDICYEKQKIEDKYLDCFDMCVWCYSIHEKGYIEREHYNNYMNLEYCKGTVKPRFKRLKAISSYLKGKIPLDLLLNVNTTTFIQNQIDRYKDTIPYIESIKKSAGI
ncbi:MAG: hypothetical protein IJ593_12730 [Lachnospiraceae bacterium]|nr:hypothetical protein [Lachnospiraceae bacterium]MBR1455488.1 hypothetical protein [Lachnospiraceae bacterium]